MDNFQERSTESAGWFNLDCEWIKRKFSTLETDFYKKRSEKNIEGQDIKAYKIFVVPLDNSKLHLSIRNDSVTPNKQEK